MRIDQQAVLRGARVAELRNAAAEVTTLCRPVPVIELPRGRDRRRLLMLLAYERRRSARLIELLKD